MYAYFYVTVTLMLLLANPRRNAFNCAGVWRKRLSTINNTKINHEDCDIVIVGGGPAGLALAAALGSSPSLRRNLSITLVEGGDLKKAEGWAPIPGSFSNRVSSLTNTSQTFLKRIGVWGHIDEARTCGIDEMQVWDGISGARIAFSASELNLEKPELGMARLTENFNLQRGLLRRLKDLPEVRLLQQTKVKSIVQDVEEHRQWPLVYLENDRVLRARLLIGADGFNSPVRAYANIPSFGWSYDTQAIVATMTHPPRGAFEGPNTTAYQRFLPTGPIAFLPLSPTASSLVWSTKPQLAAALLACEPPVLASMINAAFRLPELSVRYLHTRILEAQLSGTPITPSEIQQEISWREQSHSIDQHSIYASANAAATIGMPLEGSEAVPPLVTTLQPGTVASFPLRLNHAEAYIGEGLGARTALVGDAAHTVHPLAGQGLNMGLGDVESLARCIENAFLLGGDIGSHTALLPYAQDRYLENHILMATIDKLHKIYSTDLQPIVWARSVGLEVLNELDSLKAAIMLTAGSRTDDAQRTSATAWNVVAKGVETLVAAADASKILAGGLQNLLSSNLQRLLNTEGAPGQQKRV